MRKEDMRLENLKKTPNGQEYTCSIPEPKEDKIVGQVYGVKSRKNMWNQTIIKNSVNDLFDEDTYATVGTFSKVREISKSTSEKFEIEYILDFINLSKEITFFIDEKDPRILRYVQATFEERSKYFFYNAEERTLKKAISKPCSSFCIVDNNKTKVEGDSYKYLKNFFNNLFSNLTDIYILGEYQDGIPLKEVMFWHERDSFFLHILNYFLGRPKENVIRYASYNISNNPTNAPRVFFKRRGTI